MSTGRPHHYGHLLQVYKESLQPLTLYTSFHYLINVYSHRSRGRQPQETKFLCQQKLLVTSVICYKFQKISLKSDFIQFFFMILYMYIHVAPGQGLTTPEQAESNMPHQLPPTFSKLELQLYLYFLALKHEEN